MHHGAFLSAKKLESLIKNVMTEDKAGEGALKNLLITNRDGTFNLPFFILGKLNLCPGHESFPDLDRTSETNLGSAEHDIGVIDSQHGGIIGQTKGKSTVNQVTFISRHDGLGNQLSNRGTFTNLKRLPYQRRINL